MQTRPLYVFLFSVQTDTAVSGPRGQFLQGQGHGGLGCGKGEFWQEDRGCPYWT